MAWSNKTAESVKKHMPLTSVGQLAFLWALEALLLGFLYWHSMRWPLRHSSWVWADLHRFKTALGLTWRGRSSRNSWIAGFLKSISKVPHWLLEVLPNLHPCCSRWPRHVCWRAEPPNTAGWTNNARTWSKGAVISACIKRESQKRTLKLPFTSLVQFHVLSMNQPNGTTRKISSVLVTRYLLILYLSQDSLSEQFYYKFAQSSPRNQ